MKTFIVSICAVVVGGFALWMLFCHLFITTGAMADERNDYAAKFASSINIPHEFLQHKSTLNDVKYAYTNFRLSIHIYVDHFTELAAAVDKYLAAHKMGYTQKLYVHEGPSGSGTETVVFSKAY